MVSGNTNHREASNAFRDRDCREKPTPKVIRRCGLYRKARPRQDVNKNVMKQNGVGRPKTILNQFQNLQGLRIDSIDLKFADYRFPLSVGYQISQPQNSPSQNQ